MIKFNSNLQLFASVIIIAVSACNQKANTNEGSGTLNINGQYSKTKAMFPAKFIDQFPDSLISNVNRMSASYPPTTNRIYFFLYEYKKPIEEIDSVYNVLLRNSIAKYSALDTCLFVINEDKGSQDFSKSPFNEQCLTTKYPVPFFGLHKETSDNSLLTKLDESYFIYVLEADTVDTFDFKVKQNTGSHKWRNGYSRGISLSKEKGSIIYWSIAW